MFKLAPIGNSAAVALAGNVDLTKQILDFLLVYWDSFDGDLGRLEGSLQATFGPFNSEAQAAFLLAWISNEGPTLSQWQSSGGFIFRQSDYCDIGSLQTYHRDWTRAFVERAKELQPPTEDVLAATAAFVQSFGVHDNLIDQYVGGTFFGIAVEMNDSVSWQPDTGYFLYSREDDHPDFITTFVRENALFVHSTLVPDFLIMLNSAGPSQDRWPALEAQFNVLFRTDHFPVLVFIRKEDKVITVFRRDPLANGAVKIMHEGDSLQLAMRTDKSAEIRNILAADIEPQEGPSFRLNFFRET